MNKYDVVIIGGGPTGVALAIELGLHHISTLVLEKHDAPLFSPRAQSLNARTVEIFMRWKLHDTLKSACLLPPDYPLRGIWCSTLNGKTYAISNTNEQISDAISSQRAIRIPLWITEEVLRTRLQDLPSVTFKKRHTVVDVQSSDDGMQVIAENALHERIRFDADFVVACDGANSEARHKMGIAFDVLAPPKRVINAIFQSAELDKLITVDKGSIYYLLEGARPSAIGMIDLQNGLYYAQITDDSAAETVDQVDVSAVIDEIAGMRFNKTIIQAHFWNMHIQLARHFSSQQRFFLVGDSAHAFVPTGGFGLNTGFGDVTNLGWKLAAVIKHQADPALLDTYEKERRPVVINNLNKAQHHATEMTAMRKKHDPVLHPERFAEANAALAKTLADSVGLTMGYSYDDSPLTVPSSQFVSGQFLPHRWIDSQQSIHELLSPTQWTLIISGHHSSQELDAWIKKFADIPIPLAILNVPENTYPVRYVLIRPDWHIAYVTDQLKESDIHSRLGLMFTRNP